MAVEERRRNCRKVAATARAEECDRFRARTWDRIDGQGPRPAPVTVIAGQRHYGRGKLPCRGAGRRRGTSRSATLPLSAEVTAPFIPRRPSGRAAVACPRSPAAPPRLQHPRSRIEVSMAGPSAWNPSCIRPSDPPRPRSPAQSAASRANGARSRGPYRRRQGPLAQNALTRPALGRVRPPAGGRGRLGGPPRRRAGHLPPPGPGRGPPGRGHRRGAVARAARRPGRGRRHVRHPARLRRPQPRDQLRRPR